MESTVTIGKSHFEALLRRAEFHACTNRNGETLEYPPPRLTTIPQTEYDYLIRASSEYNILRSALFRGGLDEATLNTLLSGDAPGYPQNSSNWANAETFTKPNSAPVRFAAPVNGTPTPNPSEGYTNADGTGYLTKPRGQGQPWRQQSFGPSDGPESPPEKEDQLGTEFGDSNGSQRPPFPRNDQRTLLFSNLSDRISHKDLVNIIRGGRLLDVYLRQDKSATVSFVEGAQEFLNYAKRKDFYLHAKRVEVKWNDRQFHMPHHIANKIASGATRNLVIRGGAAKLTEGGIRDDMEHIHNLVVIDVKCKDGDVYVSTNSVHNALFARTCMMSRALYKGLKIEWYEDECAASLPKAPARNLNWNKQASTPQTKAPNLTNRFDLLNMDGDDESDDSEEDDTAFSGYGNGVGLTNWATDTGIVA